MLFELRTYDLKPAKAPVYLDNFRRNGVGLVTVSLPLGGYWMTESGRLNRIQHLWIYDDFADRERCRANLSRDEAWMTGFIPGAFVDVVGQQNRFLNLVEGSGALERVVAGRRTVHPNQPADVPMFADTLHALAIHRDKPAVSERIIALFEVLSGTDAGQFITLSAGPADTLLAGANGAGDHEILRPLSLSPLR
ncbi:MAG: hypothetical protein CL534_01700 [Ahrensia sp.]|nr:hypothetical protein [Ahrensia sp.]